MTDDPHAGAERISALAFYAGTTPPPDGDLTPVDSLVRWAGRAYPKALPRSLNFHPFGDAMLGQLIASLQGIARRSTTAFEVDEETLAAELLAGIMTLQEAAVRYAVRLGQGPHRGGWREKNELRAALEATIAIAQQCDVPLIETGHRPALARAATLCEGLAEVRPELLAFAIGARAFLATDWPGTAFEWRPEVGAIRAITNARLQGQIILDRLSVLDAQREDRGGIVRRAKPTGRRGPHPGPGPAADDGYPGPDDDDLAMDFPSDPEPPGVVVIPRLGGGKTGSSNKDVAKETENKIGHRFPLVLMPDPAGVREVLAAEFPHADRLTQRLLSGKRQGDPIAMPPTCLIGGPGGGKSTYLSRYCAALGLPVTAYACDGSADNAAAGTPRRWLSGEFCLPLRRTLETGVANGAIVWEEVNRAGGHRQGSGGTLRDALTSLLERTNSSRYRDPYLEAECDVSHVIHLATANSQDGIAPQVRDRLRFLEFPLPGPEHTGVLAQAIALEVVREQALADEWGVLDPYEVQCLRDNWGGGSIRKLRRLVEVTLQVRLDVVPGDVFQ